MKVTSLRGLPIPYTLSTISIYHKDFMLRIKIHALTRQTYQHLAELLVKKKSPNSLADIAII